MDKLAIDAVQYIRSLIRNGRKVGIFSCEDPYNTPFHKDLLKLTDYIHLVPKAGGVVIPESLDLGLQAKDINAWGVFGHYGFVHKHEICSAIKALGGDYSHYGPDLREHIAFLSKQYKYQADKSLKENIIYFVKNQQEQLQELIILKQKSLKGAVQGHIDVFGGLVMNSEDGRSYEAKILFTKNGV